MIGSVLVLLLAVLLVCLAAGIDSLQRRTRAEAWAARRAALTARTSEISDQMRGVRRELEGLQRVFNERRRSLIGSPTGAGAAPSDYAAAWANLPRSIVFIDVETTGLSRDCGIVSFGAVRLTTAPLELATLHLVFNPGRRSSPKALARHGFDDETLARQDPFETFAPAIARYLGRADLIVAHSVDFDLGFLNAELARCGQPPVVVASRCTMLEVRALGAGSASLGAIAGRLGLTRPDPHSALHDAWLTMQVFLWLNQCPFEPLRFSMVADPDPFNFVPAPAPKTCAPEEGLATASAA